MNWTCQVQTSMGLFTKEANHVLLPDWVRDLNYVHSQALQPLSRSQTGSAHCEVIFCSYCADWPLIHAWLPRTFPKWHTNRVPKSSVLRIRLSRLITIPTTLIWKSFAFTEGKSGFRIRKGSESRSEMAFGTWFSPLWTGPICHMFSYCYRDLLNWL